MTTTQLWRKMMGKLTWRITCPGCGMAHDIAIRERFISTLYFTVLPGFVCIVVASNVTLPLGRVGSGLLSIGAFVVLSTVGAWLAARRLHLG